ncbi:remorin 4.1-like [Zingiber officinale]|uniref:Remorin C-terminal domain-containing protein n=1 Tax=Zingiber officinale TaxID=94328 RepID=A0A8J5KBK6_ZINOF|nr:remorin 4.1-like [Zingiber officinale]KAG6480571.1 hypothetical protein ZIOFF_057155 [Zingiber officinale]
MLNDPRHSNASADQEDAASAPNSSEFRDIHPLATPGSHPGLARHRDAWEGGSVRSLASLSIGSVDGVSEVGFTTVSREFNAMVVAGSNFQQQISGGGGGAAAAPAEQLNRIGDDELEETNPLAIVPDNNPFPSPRRLPQAGSRGGESSSSSSAAAAAADGLPIHVVKKEEAESKIAAWQIAEVAKINNRFKREEVEINGWETEQVERATVCWKKLERRLEEQRAKAMEKMQNDVAKAHQKAVERLASAEAKRGTKVAKVLELANFMRTIGRAPSKRPFF